MIRILPIIDSPVTADDYAFALNKVIQSSGQKEFILTLLALTQSSFVYPACSGNCAFYLILKALSKKSMRKEVVLPAYTAGSLVVVVKKAGLKPVLCDISLKDFNLDKGHLLKAVSDNTLAVNCAHMFGIPMHGIVQLRQELPEHIYLIEDCAQSMGARIQEDPVGAFSDISFYSFNRGKNISLCGGGCISTNSGSLALEVEKEYRHLSKEAGILIPARVLAFSLAVNPYFYGSFFDLLARFKSMAVPGDFPVKKISDFQADLCLALVRRQSGLFRKRYENGMYLLEGLKDARDLILPVIHANVHPVFNRLPVVFEDASRREAAIKALWKAGIEASVMYGEPLHHMFDLGYGPEDFPNSVYLAGHLLTLPVYPSLRQSDLARMVEVIKKI